MEFFNDEIEQISRLVKEQALNGNIYITYCDNSDKIPLDDLSFFQDDWSANEDCYEKLTDVDRYAITTSDKVIAQLNALLSQGNMFNNLKNEIMNQDNFEYLKNQIKYTGFGEALEYDLRNMMDIGMDKFQLKHTAEYGKDKVDATLNFGLSDKGLYFFNNYQLVLHKDGVDPAKVEPLKQTFYIHGPKAVVKPNAEGKEGEGKKEWVNSNFTLREGYNLMDGRSVQKDFVSKENEKFTAWATLDMKNTDTRGDFLIKRHPDFDIESRLALHPIKELTDESSKKQLIESLQKGNRQSVLFMFKDNDERRSIEANGQFKTINIYVGNVRLTADQKEKEGKSESQANTNTQINEVKHSDSTQKDNKQNENNRQNQNRGRSKKHGVNR